MHYDGEATAMLRDQTITQRSQLGRELKRKIRDRSAKVGVVGLGYVGLPLAVEMARKGYQVTGIRSGRPSLWRRWRSSIR
jgi:hypothetical protein